MRKNKNIIFLLLCLGTMYINTSAVKRKIQISGASSFVINFIIGIAITAIIFVLTKYTFKYIKRSFYLHSPLGSVDKMSGAKFEEYLKAHFENLGYKVKLTPKSNDYGADLIVSNKKKTIVVQAKRYKSKVGNSAIQQIVAAKAYYNADECMVVTNSFFTKNAEKLAEANGVVLVDRSQINSFFYSL